MSGGSFNYLCHAIDLEELLHRQGDLEQMADFLAELGYADDVATETRRMVTDLRRVSNRLEQEMEGLRGIWRSAEWWQSSDTSEDDFKETLAKWRK